MTLAEVKRAGHRHVRRPCWPPGTFLEFIDRAELSESRRADRISPAIPIEFFSAASAEIPVIFFSRWLPRDRLIWGLGWEDYEGIMLHGED